MRRLFLTVCLLAGVAFGSTDVYRWVDEDGVVHFSDRPEEGAERVELSEAQTFSAPTPRQRTSSRDLDSGSDEEEFRYQAFDIVNPGQEEVLWNIGGQLDVSMRLAPRLRDGHRVRLFLDDQLVTPRRNTSLLVQLTEIPRGQHVLRAEVRDLRDQVLIRTQPTTFSIQQTSVLNPNNPNNAPIPTPRRP